METRTTSRIAPRAAWAMLVVIGSACAPESSSLDASTDTLEPDVAIADGLVRDSGPGDTATPDARGADGQPPDSTGDTGTQLPNFVIIMADDLGWRELGSYGSPDKDIETPHLDRLAEAGMRFTNVWATPVCTPTRVELLTGQYAFRTGWYNFIGRENTPLPTSPLYDVAAHSTFADVLRSAGYSTALVGKWQLTGSVPSMIHEAGFDEYLAWCWNHDLPEGVVHDGDFVGSTPSRYWHPCLLKNGAYFPTEANDFGPDLLVDYAIDYIERHQEVPFVLYYPMLLPHTPFVPMPESGAMGLRASIKYADALVGRIMDALERMDLRGRTYVFFVGDNGTHLDGKNEPTTRGAGVPLLVSRPGEIPVGVNHELIDFSDMLPTFAELAGVSELPTPLDGVSFAPNLRGEAVTHRDWIFSYLSGQRMVRTRRWLKEGNRRLFDCAGDPGGGDSCVEVTDSLDPEVVAGWELIDSIQSALPTPDVQAQQLIPPAP